jgi:DNA-binding MarR family transcriptional regulator
MMTSTKKPADAKRVATRTDRFKGLAQHFRAGRGDSRLVDSDLSDSLGFLMRVASGVATDQFARRLDELGLRQTLYTLLVIIAENPGLKQQEIGAILSIQQPNLVALVNELAEAGLVTRTVNADDRRSYSLNVTPAGARILQQAKTMHVVAEKRLADAVHPMSIDEFRATLLRVIDIPMKD